MRLHQTVSMWLLFVAVFGCNAKHDQKADSNSPVATTSNSIGPPAAVASAQGSEEATSEIAAIHAAELWLKLVDEGKYGDSYDTAASYFRSKVTRDAWTTMVGQVRVPLGPVQSRQLLAKKFTTTAPGAPDGQYVIIQYKTEFEHKAGGVETVTPMRDADGTWRVSGYFVR